MPLSIVTESLKVKAVNLYVSQRGVDVYFTAPMHTAAGLQTTPCSASRARLPLAAHRAQRVAYAHTKWLCGSAACRYYSLCDRHAPQHQCLHRPVLFSVAIVANVTSQPRSTNKSSAHLLMRSPCPFLSHSLKPLFTSQFHGTTSGITAVLQNKIEQCKLAG